MTAETVYERSWALCLRCENRRPAAKLTNGECNDRWCACGRIGRRAAQDNYERAQAERGASR